MARRYGFREYDGPPLETLELFTTKSGEEIVGQLYNFKDKGQREISLRPEMTPTLARMVAATNEIIRNQSVVCRAATVPLRASTERPPARTFSI